MTASADDGYDFFAAGARPATSSAASSAPTVPSGSVPAAATAPPNRAGMVAPAALTPSALTPKPSRWAKSDTTFGPVGRIVATIAMFIPLVFFVVTGVLTFDPFELIGTVIWLGLMAVGLRQVWQPVAHHHRR